MLAKKLMDELDKAIDTCVARGYTEITRAQLTNICESRGLIHRFEMRGVESYLRAKDMIRIKSGDTFTIVPPKERKPIDALIDAGADLGA